MKYFQDNVRRVNSIANEIFTVMLSYEWGSFSLLSIVCFILKCDLVFVSEAKVNLI